jgi:outer membrane protein TolC
MKLRYALYTLALTASGATPGALYAQPTQDTLRLAKAIEEAREVNPMLRAARLHADATRERIPQVGALPDPALAFALRNRPLDGFGASERMTMNSFQLRQRLPWPGKLGFAKEREQHLSEAADLFADESEVTLVARVKAVYFEIAYMDRALDIMRDTRDLLREFLDVSTTLYTVGRGLQADVLQAQVAVAGMTEDITVVEQNRLAMAARLNALRGRDANVPVPAVELPTPGGPLPEVEALMTRASNARPALQAARELTQAAEAGYRAARRALYPDVTFTLDYGQRPEFSDMLTFGVGISIPIWAGSRQLPQRKEALARQAMEEATLRDVYNETYAGIAEARAAADRARRLSTLYRTSILPQARAAVESSLSAYRVGEVNFMTLVQNELTVNRYEIETVRLTASYHAAVAEIEALVGGALEETR